MGRPSAAGAGGLTRSFLWVCFAASFALVVFYAWLVFRVGAINDGVYFVDRIQLMLRGLVPNRDFEFVYGLGPLYGGDEGRFLGTLNVLTEEDLTAKIHELRAHLEEDLLVSKEGFEQCELRGGNRTELRQLLLVPWVPAPKHVITLYVPLCTYLQENYRYVVEPSPATFGYGLMRFRATP